MLISINLRDFLILFIILLIKLYEYQLKCVWNQRNEIIQNQTHTRGDVVFCNEIIHSPTRKQHPFASLSVPQLALSLVLVATDFTHGKEFFFFPLYLVVLQIVDLFKPAVLTIFSERILEDLETLDPNKIADYNEKNDFEKDSFGASDFIRVGHDYSKYFLVLRQSTMKYDMFRRHQVKLISFSFVQKNRFYKYYNALNF